MPVEVGAQLDNYRVIEKIGEGGMGAVFRAVDVMLERDVALKFLRPELAREPELVERFRSEAVVLARLSHQYVASVFGLHRHRDDWFMAMEFVPGETLSEALKRIGRFPADAAVRLAVMVLQALEYAHRLDVVHRDIKTANVILTPSGIVKVMDFGIARVLGSQRLTRAGSIVGTIGYMAPEQIQGLDVDQRADLYSAGIMLYEMLTGHMPFEADTDWALMQAQIGEPPKPPREWVDVPEALETTILRALEKSPENRFQTATDLLAALDPAFAATRAARGAATASTGWPAVAGTPVPRLRDPAPVGGLSDETRLATPVPAVPTRPLSAPPAPVPATPPAEAPAAPPKPPVAMDQPAAVATARPRKPAADAKKSNVRWLAAGVAALLLLALGGWFVIQRSSQVAGAPEEATTRPADQAPGPGPAAAGVTSAEAIPPSPPAAPTATGGAAPGPPPAPTTQGGPSPAGARRAPATGRRTAGATGTAAGAAATAATPASPTPGTSTAAPTAPPAAAGEIADTVMTDVRLVRPTGPELPVELHFEPQRLTIRNVGGRHVLDSLDYAAIASAEYHESRPRRLFIRTTRHWLVLHGSGGEQRRFRLERDNYQQIIATVEKRLGQPVRTTAPEQDERD